MEDEAKVFGAVLIEQRRVMKRVVGEDVFARGLATVPTEQREEYEGITLLGWVRATTASEVTRAVAVEAGRDPGEFVHDIVKSGFGVVLRTIWRVLMRFSSDEALVRRAGVLFTKAVNKGTLRATPLGPGVVTLELIGWPEVGELDLIAVAAGVEAALVTVGREDIRIARRRTPEGAAFDVSMRPRDGQTSFGGD